MASNNARSDGGTTAPRGAAGEAGPADTLNATERAQAAIEEFVETCVGGSRYATGSTIVKQVDTDVRPQKVSYMASQKASGEAPDGFLEDVRV